MSLEMLHRYWNSHQMEEANEGAHSTQTPDWMEPEVNDADSQLPHH